MALIELAELARPPQPRLPSPPPVPRDADQWTGIATMEPYSGGLFGTRYEKNVNAYVPPGFIRDHIEVTLDPPNSGNVYFLDWEDSDPHIGRFRFHVGCASCQGGTATFYMHCVRDPNVIIPAARTAEQPRAVTSSSSASDESTTTAPRRSVNGTANGKNAELTGPVGGSPA
jgi:hypothetical protein